MVAGCQFHGIEPFSLTFGKEKLGFGRNAIQP